MQNFEQSVDHLQKINQEWEKLRKNEVIQRLLKGESLQIIIESLPNFKERFCELDTIDCSDGRVLDGKKIGIAGSGLLLSLEDRLKLIRQCQGKKVTTHYNCGAAALKFSQLSPEEIPAGVETADEYGTYCGQKLAQDLHSDHEFLDENRLSYESHNEVALLVDATGKFDSTHLEGFPPHFVCTGAALGLNEEYLKDEIHILTSIALGEHGFGKRFNPNNPFYILVAADDTKDLVVWKKLANEVAQDFEQRVKVAGFTRPVEN